MNYLRDNRLAGVRHQKKIKIIIFSVILALLIIFGRRSIFNFFSAALKNIGFPLWTSSNTLKEGFSGTFRTKKSLIEENQKLNDQLMAVIAEATDRKVLLDENLQLKETLGRKGSKDLILATILAKPNQSPYDTLIIDIGAKQGLEKGQRVFAHGNIFLGVISEVYNRASLVKLFSTPGETTDMILGDKNAYAQAIGRGGGNFEVTLPKELKVPTGTEAVLPGITPYVLGIVEKVVSDPRDLFQKVLLASPVNVQDLKFVQVEK